MLNAQYSMLNAANQALLRCALGHGVWRVAEKRVPHSPLSHAEGPFSVQALLLYIQHGVYHQKPCRVQLRLKHGIKNPRRLELIFWVNLHHVHPPITSRPLPFSQ